jgi:hypothetical protein
MIIAVIEDYLVGEDRCWGITHTTDYQQSTAIGQEM